VVRWKKKFGTGVLEEVVGAKHGLAFPARLRHRSRRCAVEVLGRETVEVSHDRFHPRAELLERLLGVRLRRCFLAGES